MELEVKNLKKNSTILLQLIKSILKLVQVKP